MIPGIGRAGISTKHKSYSENDSGCFSTVRRGENEVQSPSPSVTDILIVAMYPHYDNRALNQNHLVMACEHCWTLQGAHVQVGTMY